jgi:EAL domain-containing protein (putative c-di-GMP-specific phosphodiesterase class I)
MFSEQGSAICIEKANWPLASARQPSTDFELQAIIATKDSSLYGYEFLYRGQVRPTSSAGWTKIDHALVSHLSRLTVDPALACFVNLSHESLLAIPDDALIAAAARNDMRYEVSEAIADDRLFARVCEKVNRLSAIGLDFVVDDFGAGLDGNHRLYSLDRVSAVKVDRDLLIKAAQRRGAAGMLQAAVRHWNETGIVTIAEGVESETLLEFSNDMGFTLVQGYHLDKLALGDLISF